MRMLTTAFFAVLAFLAIAAVHTMDFHDMQAMQKFQLTAEQRHAIVARMERN